MELLIFIIGVTMGVILKDLIKIFKCILSLGTTFIIIKWLHPDIELLPLDEWSWSSLFYGYNFWVQSFFGFIISIAFFYWLIPKLIMYSIDKRIKTYR